MSFIIRVEDLTYSYVCISIVDFFHSDSSPRNFYAKTASLETTLIVIASRIKAIWLRPFGTKEMSGEGRSD